MRAKKMNNYYIPEIEELSIDTVYHKDIEKFDKEGPHNTFKITQFEEFVKLWAALAIGKITIKYLDQEDIESLGFVVLTTFTVVDVFEITFEMKGYSVLFNPKGSHTPWLMIKHNNTTLFAGHVKNKSEFKRILKQIGYVKF